MRWLLFELWGSKTWLDLTWLGRILLGLGNDHPRYF
jgi:hypothetical protein